MTRLQFDTEKFFFNKKWEIIVLLLWVILLVLPPLAFEYLMLSWKKVNKVNLKSEAEEKCLFLLLFSKRACEEVVFQSAEVKERVTETTFKRYGQLFALSNSIKDLQKSKMLKSSSYISRKINWTRDNVWGRKPGLVDSRLDSRSKSCGFKSRLILHYTDGNGVKAMPGRLKYPILFFFNTVFEKKENTATMLECLGNIPIRHKIPWGNPLKNKIL